MNKKAFQILELLSQSLPGYEATTWLATPQKALDGLSPYEMIKKNRLERVHASALEYIKKTKSKKKGRSNR